MLTYKSLIWLLTNFVSVFICLKDCKHFSFFLSFLPLFLSFHPFLPSSLPFRGFYYVALVVTHGIDLAGLELPASACKD